MASSALSIADVLSEDMMISLCLYLGGPSVVALSSCTRLTCSAIRSSAFLWKDLASALLGKPLVLTHLEAWRC